MPLRLRENVYRGVNAHLHSYFQAEGGWASLHNLLISTLVLDLATRLPAGYIADAEQSLQIRETHPDSGERLRRPQPDLTIYRSTERLGGASPSHPQFAVEGEVSVLTQPLTALLDDEDLYYPAAVIRTQSDQGLGDPVARIEVLSASNKAGDGALQYREKRAIAIRSGIVLVEFDLLHETPPVVPNLPQYPHDAESHPYTITVTNPIPTWREGDSVTFAFPVDVSIPDFPIPLSENVSVALALDPLYQALIPQMPAYQVRIDYAQPPLHFDRYRADDQARILRVMERAQTQSFAAPAPQD